MKKNIRVAVNEAVKILSTINDKVKISVENVDMREFDLHMPAERVDIIIEYCTVCECMLRAWYILDNGTVDIFHPFYECEEWEHHVIHTHELQRHHDMYLMEDECDPWWDYKNDQPLE